MAAISAPPPSSRVTLTIPAENIDDFRIGVIGDLKTDADGFRVNHANMFAASDEGRDIGREDRDGLIRPIRETCELLAQLPTTEDVETIVEGTTEAVQFALEEAGRQLARRVKRLFDYTPVPVDEVLPVLHRLRWTAEQVAKIDI